MFTRTVSRISALLLTLALIVTMLSIRPAVAAPGQSDSGVMAMAQNVDWMTADQASRLNLDFSVLVPTWIPAPFAGNPSIQAGGGYYSLYWMIPGGEPTFLQITGEVGGALPAGSPADLNQQLFINASVQGYDAIHDVTSIYDNVWWIAGGVLYTVSSRNMTGTDSLSLANSLVPLSPPVVEEPEPTPTPPPAETEAVEQGPGGSIFNASSVASGGSASLEVYPSGTGTLRATDGVFTSSGSTSITGLTGGVVSWQAPAVSSQSVVEFTLLDADTGVVTAGSSIIVYPTQSDDTSGEGSNGTTATETATTAATETATEEGSNLIDAVVQETTNEGAGGSLQVEETPVVVQTPASGGTNGAVASDGTAGADVPRTGDGTAGPQIRRGGDGTGGLRQIVIP